MHLCVYARVKMTMWWDGGGETLGQAAGNYPELKIFSNGYKLLKSQAWMVSFVQSAEVFPSHTCVDSVVG